MSSDWKPIWEKIKAWHGDGRKVALATVVDTWGSSPRPTGSYMIVGEDGAIEGSVSGGCIEGAVIEVAQNIIKNGNISHKPQILDFSVSNDQAWEVGLSCGGHVRVMVESIEEKLPYIDDILLATETVILTTDYTTGATTISFDGNNSQKSGLSEEEPIVFTHVLEQPLKLFVIGAVHITQAMVKIAQSLDISVTVIDPRRAFATTARFPEGTLCLDWPDEALLDREITSGTAIVTLTHDPKLDDLALEVALKSNSFYIASLGSRKTHAARRERLQVKGFKDEQIKRIYGPAGLSIGAKTPAEIALSVMAQMISVYRNGEE